MTVWHSLSSLFFLSLSSTFLFQTTKIQLSCLHIVLGFCFASFLNFEHELWTVLSSFGAAILAFLAGNEFDHKYLRAHTAKLIPFGLLSFAIPFISILLVFIYGIGWSGNKAIIASIALAETSIAMVYSVITSRNYGEVGKFVFCALHLTDILILLGITFVIMDFTMVNAFYFILLNFVPLLAIGILKKKNISEKFLEVYGSHLFIFLIVLCALSTKYIQALPVMPVFLLGLYSSDFTRKHPTIKNEIKKFGYLFLIPLYFLRAGSLVSWETLRSSFNVIFVLVVVKMLSKVVPLFPLARKYGYSRSESGFISWLMATGLTFGTFIILFAYDTKIFTQSEYSMLLCTVVITALLPTLLAEKSYNLKDKK